MLSFVIPAHNEEALVGQTIASIQAAARAVGEPFEVIVADDASTDRTAAIAREHGAQVVSVNKRQIAAVRNAGAREARGEVLIFVDADTLLPEATLRAALAALAGGVIGGGAMVRMDEALKPSLRPLMWIWNAISRFCRYAAGCFIFVRREAFEAIGGFNEEYYVSEEIQLSRALKPRGRFVVLPQHVVTSARKLRLYGTLRLLGMSVGLLCKGPKAWRRREGLWMWYEGKRENQPPPGR